MSRLRLSCAGLPEGLASRVGDRLAQAHITERAKAIPIGIDGGKVAVA